MKRALSQSQAAELLRAASLLPLASRDAFISEVDSRLCGVRRKLTDADVSAAIVSTLTVLNVTTSHFHVRSQTGGPMTTRNYEIFETRTGRRIEEDDDDVLRDGQTLRVPLHMRDGHSPMQREVMEDKAARRFGLDDATALHRPGYKYCVDADARARVEEARAQWIQEMTDGWKTTAPGAVEFRGAQEGDVCTVREGGVGEGGPGHLKRIGGKLVCVPGQRHDSLPRTMTAADAQPIRDAAYRQYCDELVNAWKAR